MFRKMHMQFMYTHLYHSQQKNPVDYTEKGPKSLTPPGLCLGPGPQ